MSAKTYTLGSVLGVAAACIVIGGCGGGGGGSTSTPTQSTPVTPSLTSINLPAPAQNVAVGATVQLSATALDQSGNAFNGTLNWSSSNTPVASVAPATGLVTGVSNGTAVITVGSGSVQNSVTVGVGNGGGASPLNASVQATEQRTFSPGQVTIQAGGTVQFAFVGIQHTVTFSSSGSPADIPATSGRTIARSFGSAGTYNYVCSIHSGMSGSIVVR